MVDVGKEGERERERSPEESCEKNERKGGRRTMVSVDETFPQGRVADELRVEREKEVSG